MSRYAGLADMFPWKVLVSVDDLEDLMNFLNTSLGVPDGSSYAVTITEASDKRGYRWLWLSTISERRLRQAAMLTGLTVMASRGE